MAITASEARKNLFPLIERVNDDHTPIEITSRRGDAVHGWGDYTYWLGADRDTLKRINRLIDDAPRDPTTGIGKPEPLRQHDDPQRKS